MLEKIGSKLFQRNWNVPWCGVGMRLICKKNNNLNLYFWTLNPNWWKKCSSVVMHSFFTEGKARYPSMTHRTRKNQRRKATRTRLLITVTQMLRWIPWTKLFPLARCLITSTSILIFFLLEYISLLQNSSSHKINWVIFMSHLEFHLKIQNNEMMKRKRKDKRWRSWK